MPRTSDTRQDYSPRERSIIRRILEIFDVVSVPLLAMFLLSNRDIDPSYGLTRSKRVRLVFKMYRNTRRIDVSTSFRAHVAMAAKILEVPASVDGVIVECGCWRGGTTANLSLVADIVGRQLIAYDSFEGLPPPTPGDRWASELATGAFDGALDVVRDNVKRYGAVKRCEFRKGWYNETLSGHTEPIIFLYADVDYQQSLHDVVVNLWSHLIDTGYFFIDEYMRLDYCALFFSEKWWRTYFDRPPPGLMGPGTGIGVGQFFLGPRRSHPPLQAAKSVAYTRKDFFGMWDYYPEEEPEVRSGGGQGAAHGPDGWTLTVKTIEEVHEKGLERAILDQLAAGQNVEKIEEAIRRKTEGIESSTS